MKSRVCISILLFLLVVLLASCESQKLLTVQNERDILEKQLSILQAKVDAFEAEKALEEKNLALFDEMDFVAFTNHDIPHIDRLHAEDVLVVNPDLSEIRGRKPHSNDMAYLFQLFPDMAINEHPVKFASGNWTAGLGIAEMTFTKPYMLQDGTTIPPNNKKYKRGMITLAKWKDGKIVEEYIFYDNMSFIQQLKADQ